MSGYLDWINEAPEARTKISPNDPPTQLDGDDQTTFGGVFGVQISF